MKPASAHDITAARAHCLPALYLAAAAGLPSLADQGYQGAGIGVRTPFRGRNLGVDNRAYNTLASGTRATGERANALLDQRWAALRHVTLPPSRTGDTIATTLVLTPLEREARRENLIEWHKLGAPVKRFGSEIVRTASTWGSRRSA